MPTDRKTYLSNGRVLEAPPVTVRVNRFIESIHLFIGLYLVSFFSLNPYKSARYSQYNISESENEGLMRPRWGTGGGGGGGGSGYGGGGGSGPSGGGSGGPRTMGVDDIRAPECGSCG